MTIKEAYGKVATYNEVAEAAGTDSIEIAVNIGDFLQTTIRAADYAGFRKAIRREYIKQMADAILSYDGYEFGKRSELTVTVLGDIFSEGVEVAAERKW